MPVERITRSPHRPPRGENRHRTNPHIPARPAPRARTAVPARRHRPYRDAPTLHRPLRTTAAREHHPQNRDETPHRTQYTPTRRSVPRRSADLPAATGSGQRLRASSRRARGSSRRTVAPRCNDQAVAIAALPTSPAGTSTRAAALKSDSFGRLPRTWINEPALWAPDGVGGFGGRAWRGRDRVGGG